jgi:membrane AbrB-like protein
MKLTSHPVMNAMVLAVFGGVIAQFLHIPLPWMIGPMLAMVTAKIRSLPVRPPTGGRETGQLIIGTAIGTFFTPPVLEQVKNAAGLMLAAGFASILIGYLTALVVARLAAVDRTTAFFACVPGGAAEMVVLGERYGAAGHFVAMAQSLRMMLVVLVVPPLFALSGVTGSLAYSSVGMGVAMSGLAILLLCTAGAGFLMQRIGAPTPWLLGPLLCSVALAATDNSLTAMPPVLSNLGQYLVGCAIGSRFERDFLVKAPRLLSAAVAGTFLTMLLSALLGILVGLLGGIPLPSTILATAPGGIAEMGVTAKVLMLGVPLVTAFHATRLLVLLTMTDLAFRAALYLRAGVRRRP